MKNQDFLAASGALSLKGQEGISALEEDVQAVRGTLLLFGTLADMRLL